MLLWPVIAVLQLLQVARLHDPLVAGVVVVVRRATRLVLLLLPLLLVHLLAEDGGAVVAVGTVVLHGLRLARTDRRLVLLHEVAVLLGAERGPAVDVARLVALLLLDLVARLDSAVLRERVARPDSHDRAALTRGTSSAAPSTSADAGKLPMLRASSRRAAATTIDA